MPWTTLRAEGTALPEGRGGHAVAVLDTATQQHLYVFGGADRSPCAFADLWRLTLSGACGCDDGRERPRACVRIRRSVGGGGAAPRVVIYIKIYTTRPCSSRQPTPCLRVWRGGVLGRSLR